MAAAATPLPREDSTPPVIKISLVFTGSLIYPASADVKKGLERPASAIGKGCYTPGGDRGIGSSL
jgi:hypothetical protein